jgi:hypothetical protein
MPRPRPLTEEIWRERQEERERVDAVAFRRAEEPTEVEIERDVALAAHLVTILGIPRDRRAARRTEIVNEVKRDISELTGLLGEVRWEWQVRRKIDPSLPVIGGIQLTDGEWQITLRTLARSAKKQHDEWAAKKLARWAARFRPQHRRPPGRRAVAQLGARYLIRFMHKRAPDAPIKQRREFVFCAMRGLGIDVPDLEKDPGDFNTWFDEVEALATAPRY